MAKKFRSVNRDQVALLPVDMNRLETELNQPISELVRAAEHFATSSSIPQPRRA